MTSLTKDAVAAARREAPRRRALEELLRPRPRVAGCTPGPSSRRSSGSSERFAKNAAGARRQPAPRSRPATPSARPPSCSTTRTRSARPRYAPGHLHEHHRQHRAGLGPGRRRPAGQAAAVPRRRTRSRRRPTSSTSCRSTRTSASARCRPRTRSPASAPPSAPRSAATSASPPPAGPGIALKGETIGLAVSLELPLLIIDIQRGGPSTGLPTKTEEADLLHGDVRPPRRVAAADRRRLQPGALLRRRHRGGPHRAQVPDAGDPAVRRLPRQRLRAVAAARRRRPARHLASTFATEPNHTDADGDAEFWPYLRDPETLARPWAHPRHARARCTASAASRRRTAPATSPTTRTTTSAWSHLRAAKVAGIANDIPPVEVDGDVDDAELLVLGWGSTWGAIDGAVDRGPGPGPQGGPRPPRPPQPVPAEPRRGRCAATRRCSCPR